MYTYTDLLERLRFRLGQGRRLALMIGSGVTLPEVPGTTEIVSRIEKLLPDHHKNRLSRSHAVSRYQIAADLLIGVRGVPELNQVIREAVLSSVRPEAVARLPAEPTPEDLERLERRPGDWRINYGIEALGRFLVSRPDRVSGPVLTTNFDPHIEVGIRRAGGSAAPIILSRDGNPGQIRTARDIPVVHLHGWWRDGDTLHLPEQLEQARPQLKAWLQDVLRDCVVLVLGYGGWKDVFTESLHELADRSTLEVLWCLFQEKDDLDEALQARVVKPFAGQPRVPFFCGVDSNRLLPDLEGLLEESGVTPDPKPEERHRPEQRLSARSTGPAAAILLALVLLGVALWPGRPVHRSTRIQILLDDRPVHLGDNIFQTFLVPDPAQVPDPLQQGRNDIVFFDKESLQFVARSLSSRQAALLADLSKQFALLDFSSYRHVRLADATEIAALGLEPVPSPRVVPIGGGRFLVWSRERGNYHLGQAAVLVSYRLDLPARIRANLPSSDDFSVSRVVAAVELSHGGAPGGTGGQILLAVNGHAVNLTTLLHNPGQQRETAEVDISAWTASPDQGPLELSLVTGPIVESTPIPGPDDPVAQARPVHFREVMISRVTLWVDATLKSPT